MDINRENYEIWFIDYLDGHLDEQSKGPFHAFLEANPDLAEELQTMENVSLESSGEVYEQKEELFKFGSDLDDIGELDCLMIKKIEEGLTNEEELRLAAYIDKNPKLLFKLREYMNARLFADETVQYSSKTSLLRRRFRPVKMVWSGIAAGFLLFLGFQGYHFFQTGQESFSPGVQLSRMTPREPGILPVKDISAAHLTLSPVKMTVHIQDYNALSDHSISDKENELSGAKLSSFEPSLLASKGVEDLEMQLVTPNAYETGLRHMMPLYLDINNNRHQLFAEESTQKRQGIKENSILLRGLQFVDNVSGELINFDKIYDDQGNYIAYNLKAINLEIEQKFRR